MTEVRKRQLAWVAGISAIVALLAVWTFAIDWEWSFFGDDAGNLRQTEAWRSMSLSMAMNDVVQETWSLMASWGLFIPTYQVYTAFVYLLPPGLAIGLRTVFWGLCLAAPAKLLLAREGESQQKLGMRSRSKHVALLFVLSLSLANSALNSSVYFVGMAELVGMACVAVGLLLSPGLARGLMFFLAALAKAPFIWLSLIYSVILVSHPRTRYSGILLLSGNSISLIVIVFAALNGSYTGANLQLLNPFHYLMNLERLMSSSAPLLAVLIIGLLFCAQLLRFSLTSVALLLGASFYALNLMPWTTFGYYNGPVWFLVTCGLAAALRPTAFENKSTGLWPLVAMTGCLVFSGLVAANTVRDQIMGRNQMVNELVAWAGTKVDSNVSIGLSGIDPNEFNFYVLKDFPTWDGRAERLSPDWTRETEPKDFVAVATDFGTPIDATLCPPIKVWTRGFLAPLKC